MNGLVQRVIQSAALWPVSILWIVGSVVSAVIAEGWVSWPIGVVLWTLVASVVILASAARELKRELNEIHRLVNGHRDMLVRRVEVLEKALRQAEVPVPEEVRR
jgi:hypothetical protein